MVVALKNSRSTNVALDSPRLKKQVIFLFGQWLIMDKLSRSNFLGNPLGEGSASEAAHQVMQALTETTGLPSAHNIVQKGIRIIPHGYIPL
jgi:hypothetical protein